MSEMCLTASSSFLLSSSLLPFKLLYRSDYSVSTWWSSCVALWWNPTVLCLWLVLSSRVSPSEQMLPLPECQKPPKIHTISSHCICTGICARTHSLLSLLHLINPAGLSFPDQIKTIRTWGHEDGHTSASVGIFHKKVCPIFSGMMGF